MKRKLFGTLLLALSLTVQAQQQVVVGQGSTKKYYSVADVTSIDVDGSTIKVNQAGGTDTYTGTVDQLSFIRTVSGQVNITEARGWLESAYVKFAPFEGAVRYHVYVKGGQYADYTLQDEQLVRNYGTYGRADVPGLRPAADYRLRVVPVNASGRELTAAAAETELLEVKAFSREGFAHKNWTVGVGAYKDDGTLKSGARVIYVTKQTAKTVTASVVTSEKGAVTECTGLQTIIDAYQKGYDKTPLCVRLVGKVTLDDLDHISSSAEGLQIKGRAADSELNITIEGLGDDATVYGFGFLVRNAKSVELRNLGVMLCMDDGISLDTDNQNIWIHHIDVFYGKNKGGDQKKGDGAIDVKSDSKQVTIDHCHFWDTGKSSMAGMTSESGPNYLTYHHNWFDHSDSRHARVRTMSVHLWNNYFDNVAKYGTGACTGSSVFAENNYFLNTKKPLLSSQQGTDALGSGTFSGEDGGLIKAYGNYFDRTAKNFKYYTQAAPATTGYDAYETATRQEQVPATEVTRQGGTKYNNFDTDAALMYDYVPEAAEDVPASVTGYYGAGRLNHGDVQFTFSDNVGDDTADSAINTELEQLIKGYQSALVGFFGETPASGGDDNPDDPDSPDTPEGTILASFDGQPSHSMFTVGGNYGDGKITYEGTYYKKGVKLDSKGSITFTPQQDYTMTLVLGTAKGGRNVKLNGSVTTVGGTENSEGKYYQLEGISITKGTEYQIAKGSAESLVMLIKLEPKE